MLMEPRWRRAAKAIHEARAPELGGTCGEARKFLSPVGDYSRRAQKMRRFRGERKRLMNDI